VSGIGLDRRGFVWHKTAEQILERLDGYCTAINEGASRRPGRFHSASAFQDT
jgi:hypothetical protein